MPKGKKTPARSPKTLGSKAKGPKRKQVDDYRHDSVGRPNNPPAGLAWQDTERPPKRKFEYDPHLDPQLVWAGKAERTSFEVEAPSIHVHERLSTEAIIRAVQKEPPQLALFGDDRGLDRSKAVEFYQHEMGWVNRLILGDSLVVMTSLLEKERLGGRVQMIYFDPPYGINYNSNFQARISNRTPKETDDQNLTREPEQIQAYRDTWILGISSYLTYLRDRLLLAHELLADSGSVFVQIGPDRVHLVRILMDEVFGRTNQVTTITVQKTSQVTSKLLPEVADFLLWYAKDKAEVRYFQLFEDRKEEVIGNDAYKYVEIDGARRLLTGEEREDPALLPEGARVYQLGDATSQGFSTTKTVDFEFQGRMFHPGPNRHWLLRSEGMEGLARANRLAVTGNTLRYVRYADEAGLARRTNVWTDTGRAGFEKRKKKYVVETNPKIVERCLLMTTQPGDLVLDPTCGSGTTAWVAEKHGRRWLTVDTSRVALALARERVLTASFPFYRLRDETRGIDAGLRYHGQPWIKASSIGYEQDDFEETTLYDRPEVDGSRIRVSGPFSVEALSRYAANPMQGEPPDQEQLTLPGTDHLSLLIGALKIRGIPRHGGKPIPIADVRTIDNVGAIQGEGTFLDADGTERTFAVSFGPRFGPVTVAQIDDALHDAYGYDLVVFAGFAADAEAQKYVSKGKLGKFQVALLEANPDLLVGDLLKNTTASQTFRLFAAPDATFKAVGDGEVVVELLGVDAFDAATGEVTSGSQRDIAAWFLDQDYDGLVFHVCQAFFPRTESWESLEKALKGTIDPELMARLDSFQSLPFKPGEHGKAAVRVVDDSGSTSEVVLDLGSRS